MPDKCVRELNFMYSYAIKHAKKISIFGCSMGAYFDLLTFADTDIDRVWFLSPVTDMERIIHNLMNYCHITEDTFKKKVFIDNNIEPIYFPYYVYVTNHLIKKWTHKTFILRGENDAMCEYDYVKKFVDEFGCELTEQKDGEHWFHTDTQLKFFREWLEIRLS